MIDIVNKFNVRAFEKTAQGFDLIEAQSRVRYLALRQLGWDAPIFDDTNQMEHDDFDTNDTTYLVKRGSVNGGDPSDVQVVVRVNPTIKPYMLQASCFTDASANPEVRGFIRDSGSLVQERDVMEGSRMASHPDLDKETRRQGIAHLVLAKAEFMKRTGVSYMVGMMPIYFWDSVFRRTGWNVMPFGEQVQFSDGSEAQAARYWMTDEAYEIRRAELGVSGSLLNMGEDYKRAVSGIGVMPKVAVRGQSSLPQPKHVLGGG